MTISPAATAAAATAAAATAAAATAAAAAAAAAAETSMDPAIELFASADINDPWADMPPLSCEICEEAISYGGCAYELDSPTTVLCQCH